MEFNEDDIIIITKVRPNRFYKVGDKARLIYYGYNYWKADFTMNDDYYSHGCWWLSESGTEFEIFNESGSSESIMVNL